MVVLSHCRCVPLLVWFYLFDHSDSLSRCCDGSPYVKGSMGIFLLVMVMEREKQMLLLMQMLVYTVLAMSQPQLLSAVVFLLGHVTRFP